MAFDEESKDGFADVLNLAEYSTVEGAYVVEHILKAFLTLLLRRMTVFRIPVTLGELCSFHGSPKL